MAFKWETQWNSPNYTAAANVYATWGRPRTIEAIAIHWWGDPSNNPTYEGVVSYLCRPNGNSSAHIVATGTGRRAACIIDLEDASWATNSANPYTISIECDPRCRNEDYDVVGEVIAQIRSIYGNLPLVPHRQFTSTSCPGNYDLNRLNAVANSKHVTKADDWGQVRNKEQPKPSIPKPQWIGMETPRKMAAATDLRVLSLDNNKPIGDVVKAGTVFDFNQKTVANGTTYLRTVYSTSNNLNHGIDIRSLKEVPAPAPTPKPETPSKPSESDSKVGLDKESTTLLQDVKKLLQELIQLLRGIFKIGDK